MSENNEFETKIRGFKKELSPTPWIFCGSHIDDALGRTILRDPRPFELLNSTNVLLATAAPAMLEFIIWWRNRLSGTRRGEINDFVEEAEEIIKLATKA